jgi:L-lactate utilization protein LutC
MNELWDTKDGPRRVRRDPPTVEEAVLAAQGLTDELSEQTEIVASLMQISAEEARGAVLRMVQRKDVDRIVTTRATRVAGPGWASAASRPVVVERRGPRRPLQRRSIGR